MNEIERCFHEDRDALFTALSDRLVALLALGIAERGKASLVVPGGSTPGPLFEALSRRDLNWAAVTVTTSDERWVPEDHPDSNARLVREHLLRDKAAGATLVPLTSARADPEQGEAEVAEALTRVPRPFDAVVLGMGTDGHTASLFPGADNLIDALAGGGVVRAIHAPGATLARMTLTAPVLLDTRAVIVLATGDEKRRVLGQAISPGPVEELPVRTVLHQHLAPVSVFWAP